MKTERTSQVIVPPTMETPNLDGMDKDELWAFWSRWHRASRAQAVKLVGVRPLASKLAHTLANYACNKSVAMSCRLNGDITAAQCYEHAAELCYERLPDDLRW